MMRKYHRPTVVVAFDAQGQGRGSGRSIPGLSLVEALEGCKAHLLKFGGHEMAAGVSVEREAFEAFREAFESEARARLNQSLLEPTLEIDAELLLREVNTDLLDLYERLSPFGMGNPNPVFLLRGVTPGEEPRWVKERHLQLSLRQGRVSGRAIWFNALQEPLPSPPWDIAFEVSRNEYRGVVSAQILVRALRATEPTPSRSF
jgi:single-stranded-DNA-specific exonuclease